MEPRITRVRKETESGPLITIIGHPPKWIGDAVVKSVTVNIPPVTLRNEIERDDPTWSVKEDEEREKVEAVQRMNDVRVNGVEENDGGREKDRFDREVGTDETMNPDCDLGVESVIKSV